MCTEENDKEVRPRGNQGERLLKLAQSNESLFHTKDLANLWQITNRNTLYTVLKRYSSKGLLSRVYKGLYATRPLTEINPLLTGIKALHRYSYISTETVLVNKGIIQQSMYYITIVSSVSKNFTVGEYQYNSRQLQDSFLYNKTGISQDGGINVASVSRAVADLLYFNPKMYFDNSNFIDWDEVRFIQKEIGYEPAK